MLQRIHHTFQLAMLPWDSEVLVLHGFLQSDVGPHRFFSTGEIDRCLKKVAEGVEQFEDIWQKVRCFFCCFFASGFGLVFYFENPKTWHVRLLVYIFSSTMQPMQTRRKNTRLTSRKRLKNYRWERFFKNYTHFLHRCPFCVLSIDRAHLKRGCVLIFFIVYFPSDWETR